MAHLLITSGPTRQYLDPVRFLTNGSSGRMGQALSESALRAGHRVTIISGPVEVQYPAAAEVVWVTTTDEMLEAARRLFPDCDGAIGVAAPCDYRPQRVESRKIAKTGEPLVLHLVETPDVIAELGQHKRPDQWVVAFALETDDHRFRALRKLEQKSCDLIIVNGASAIQAVDTSVEVINRAGEVLLAASGSKPEVAARILELIERQLMH